jgi:hypothetical protein
MTLTEYVPVQIIETGEEVKARIEIDPLEKEVTYIKLQSQKICNWDTCLIKIGSKIIPFDLINAEEDVPPKITLECKEELPYSEWMLIINNALRGITIEQTASEWSDIYNQKPIEKDYLTDDQKHRIHKLLLKEIDIYFRSNKTNMSCSDFIAIEEIIIKVLEGE